MWLRLLTDLRQNQRGIKSLMKHLAFLGCVVAVACCCAPPVVHHQVPVKPIPDSIAQLLARCQDDAKSPPRDGLSMGGYYDVVRVSVEGVEPISDSERHLMNKEDVAASARVLCRLLRDSRVIEAWRRDDSIGLYCVPSESARNGINESPLPSIGVGREYSVIVRVFLIPLWGVRLAYWVATVPE